MQPTVARTGEVGDNRLHPIPAAGEWKVDPLQALLPAQANQPVGHKNASPMVDDTA